jgi:hypothetical protein
MEDYRFRPALKRAAKEGEALALKIRAGLMTIDEARAAVRESRREASRPKADEEQQEAGRAAQARRLLTVELME